MKNEMDKKIKLFLLFFNTLNIKVNINNTFIKRIINEIIKIPKNWVLFEI